jgi:monofunctional glycosyltransferase
MQFHGRRPSSWSPRPPGGPRRQTLRATAWGVGRGRPRRRFRGVVLLVALAAAVAAGALWMTLPDVEPLAQANPATTAFIELRRTGARERGQRFRLRWKWRRLREISPYLRHAVINAEDARFWQHEGVDWEAVRKAAEHNWEDKGLSHGASTITQQVAKNLYLSPSRDPVRKLRELLIAWRLESRLSKRRLLEIYLNVAEWGDGVFGAEAAAERWFGCSAAALSPAQAARLAVALPSPHRFSPAQRAAFLDRKAARLLRAMRRDRLIDAAQLERALGELAAASRTARR